MNAEQVTGMMHAVEKALQAQRDELNRLDSQLGDGDHGTGLCEGFAEAVRRIDALENPAPGDILQAAAMALMNRMGGASGALYGTLFLRAGTSITDKDVLSPDDIAGMWQAGLDGVMQRGKAQPGDKTMIDALAPAAEAFRHAVEAGDDLAGAFGRAADAARNGALRTSELIAQHGRAKFVGERGVGHVDAGAMSIAVMFEAIRDYFDERDG